MNNQVTRRQFTGFLATIPVIGLVNIPNGRFVDGPKLMLIDIKEIK